MGTLEHKFEMGQHLYPIHRQVLYSAEPCRGCDGAKLITVDGERFKCPRCEGSGSCKAGAYKWHISLALGGAVGKIEIELLEAAYFEEHGYDDRKNPRVTYMLTSTGVGSGTVYDEPHLFASRAEAEAAFKFRNENPYTWESSEGSNV